MKVSTAVEAGSDAPAVRIYLNPANTGEARDVWQKAQGGGAPNRMLTSRGTAHEPFVHTLADGRLAERSGYCGTMVCILMILEQ